MSSTQILNMLCRTDLAMEFTQTCTVILSEQAMGLSERTQHPDRSYFRTAMTDAGWRRLAPLL